MANENGGYLAYYSSCWHERQKVSLEQTGFVFQFIIGVYETKLVNFILRQGITLYSLKLSRLIHLTSAVDTSGEVQESRTFRLHVKLESLSETKISESTALATSLHCMCVCIDLTAQCNHSHALCRFPSLFKIKKPHHPRCSRHIHGVVGNTWSK